MSATVRPIDEHEYDAARCLAVEPEQQDLVAPVAASLESMIRYPGAEPLGIFVSGELVGFMMGQLVEGEDLCSRYLIWDLLVDRAHQGRGIGRVAVAAAVRHAAGCGATAVMLSYEPMNAAARDLYRSSGFAETGSVNADGEHEMLITITGDQPSNSPRQTDRRARR